MTDDLHIRARAVFLELSTLDASASGADVDRLVGDDIALRAAVISLLDARQDASQAGLMTADTSSHDIAAITESAGTTIGPYKLLQLIGEGGFGSVFLAEQAEPVRRRVALKIIKLGMDTKQVIARFEAERQALALMDHPNIARVFDAGSTALGRPYFAMEYVVGDAITKFADDYKLNLPARLELLAQVCSAVQHAHTKGIIHRDLKPANVLVSMVDGKPFAKVIDFGIVKATASPLTHKTLFTEHRQLIGTPEYMSPEQAEGSPDIDTRTDVYALGVLLYELLTGATPFDTTRLRSAAWAEMQRIIREEEPPLPSMRLTRDAALSQRTAANRQTEPPRLTNSIRGELDWIVMKALDKDRGRRYATPLELAEDIRKHLLGDAVEAAPPSTAYRLRKFFQRNKGSVIAAAAVITVLVLGIAGTTTALLIAQYNADVANHNAGLFMASSSEAEWSAYTANLALAQNAIEAGDWPSARAYLDACPESKRGWEWRFMVLHASSIAAELPGAWNEISPDGSLVLSAQGQWARLYSAVDGVLLREVRVDDSMEFYGGRFSGDGSVAATHVTLKDRRDHPWPHRTLLIPTDPATAPTTLEGELLAINHRGTKLALSRFDTSGVYTSDGTLLAPTPGTKSVNSHRRDMHFGDDDQAVAGLSDDGVRIWDINGTGFVTLSAGSQLGTTVRISPDGRLVAANTQSGFAVWDLRGTLVFEDDTFDGAPNRIQWSDDGSIVVASAWKGPARAWKSTGDFLVEIPRSAHGNEVVSVAPDGSEIATSTPLGVRITDVHTGSSRVVVIPNAFSNGVVHAPDGRSVFIDRGSDLIQVADSGTTVASGSIERGQFMWLDSVSTSSAFVFDGSDAGYSGSLSVVNLPLRLTRQRLKWDEERAAMFADSICGNNRHAMSVSLPNGQRTISAAGRILTFSETTTGREVLSLPVDLEVESLRLTPNADRLVITFFDGSLEVLDTRTAASQAAALVEENNRRTELEPAIDRLLSSDTETKRLRNTVVADPALNPTTLFSMYELLNDRLLKLEQDAQQAFKELTHSARNTEEGRAAVRNATLPARVHSRALELASEWEYRPPKQTKDQQLSEETRRRRLAEATLSLSDFFYWESIPGHLDPEMIADAVATRAELLGQDHPVTSQAQWLYGMLLTTNGERVQEGLQWCRLAADSMLSGSDVDPSVLIGVAHTAMQMELRYGTLEHAEARLSQLVLLFQAEVDSAREDALELWRVEGGMYGPFGLSYAYEVLPTRLHYRLASDNGIAERVDRIAFVRGWTERATTLGLRGLLASDSTGYSIIEAGTEADPYRIVVPNDRFEYLLRMIPDTAAVKQAHSLSLLRNGNYREASRLALEAEDSDAEASKLSLSVPVAVRAIAAARLGEQSEALELRTRLLAIKEGPAEQAGESDWTWGNSIGRFVNPDGVIDLFLQELDRLLAGQPSEIE